MGQDLSQHVDAKLDRLAGPAGRFALGYSGGGDSHALLLLASAWARTRGRELIAFIVDHGLRPESAAEAALAAGRARACGVEAEILRWSGRKPAETTQSVARAARHALLAEACAARGMSHLLLAHTLDDQAETVWMRLAAGGGWRSLAAMREVSPSPAWPQGRGLCLVRPLLDVRRQTLRDYLTQAGAEWIEDPSNLDTRFTRIRTRERLARLQARQFDPARLAQWADAIADIDRAEAEAAGHLAMAALRLESWGGAQLELEHYARAQECVRLRLLDALVFALAITGTTPARRQLRQLDRALLVGERTTAAGLMTEQWTSASWVLRDPGSLLGRVDRAATPLEPHRMGAEIRLEASLKDAQIAPLGRDYSTLRHPECLQVVPGIARPGLTAVRHCGEIIALPGLLGDKRVGFENWVPERLVTRLFAVTPPAWFDIETVIRTPAETLSP